MSTTTAKRSRPGATSKRTAAARPKAAATAKPASSTRTASARVGASARSATKATPAKGAPASARAASRTYRTTLRSEGSLCAIPVPFDPREVFGLIRAPVVVSLNGHSYRSTITSMGSYWVPLRRSNREAAGLRGDETLEVTLTHDLAPRTVDAPPDLAKALRAAGVWPAWQALAFTHQREHVEAIAQAKQPATRARRIAACVAMVTAKAR